MSDSDSSIDDAGDYTETNVLLGYASKESTEDSVSQLGGYPVNYIFVLLNNLNQFPSTLLTQRSLDMARSKLSTSFPTCPLQDLQRPDGATPPDQRRSTASIPRTRTEALRVRVSEEDM
jgi:hypothetical protein